MIDMLSGLSVSVFIERKHLREVSDKIMQYWVAAGWGVMKGVLLDNEGEFSTVICLFEDASLIEDAPNLRP